MRGLQHGLDFLKVSLFLAHFIFRAQPLRILVESLVRLPRPLLFGGHWNSYHFSLLTTAFCLVSQPLSWSLGIVIFLGEKRDRINYYLFSKILAHSSAYCLGVLNFKFWLVDPLKPPKALNLLYLLGPTVTVFTNLEIAQGQKVVRLFISYFFLESWHFKFFLPCMPLALLDGLWFKKIYTVICYY